MGRRSPAPTRSVARTRRRSGCTTARTVATAEATPSISTAPNTSQIDLAALFAGLLDAVVAFGRGRFLHREQRAHLIQERVRHHVAPRLVGVGAARRTPLELPAERIHPIDDPSFGRREIELLIGSIGRAQRGE